MACVPCDVNRIRAQTNPGTYANNCPFHSRINTLQSTHLARVLNNFCQSYRAVSVRCNVGTGYEDEVNMISYARFFHLMHTSSMFERKVRGG